MAIADQDTPAIRLPLPLPHARIPTVIGMNLGQSSQFSLYEFKQPVDGQFITSASLLQQHGHFSGHASIVAGQ
ncbi:MAG: hypothetical protein DYG94_11475 [Leptolyngbya sp. PLA3]|nr:hypothetical protein [Leptolyngbya sp. PL-A3]